MNQSRSRAQRFAALSLWSMIGVVVGISGLALVSQSLMGLLVGIMASGGGHGVFDGIEALALGIFFVAWKAMVLTASVLALSGLTLMLWYRVRWPYNLAAPFLFMTTISAGLIWWVGWHLPALTDGK